MTFKEIQELIKLINKSNLTEFKMKDGDFRLSIRTKKYGKNRMAQIMQSPQQIVPVSAPMAQMQVPMSPAVSPSASVDTSSDAGTASEEGSSEEGNYVEVRSPIVGTFYRSASPDKPQYVKPGDTIEVGSVVCIVEAMKLFNEIESEVSGKIVKVMLEDASPVQYDQVLFLVDPKG